MTRIVFRRPVALRLLAYGEPDEGYSTARVTSPYGQRGAAFHAGLDIGNYRTGDAVVAAAAGRVVGVGYLRQPWSEPTNRFPPSPTWGGLIVAIQHGPSTWTLYAHLGTIDVTDGQEVKAGQRIGTIGNTGAAKEGGAHLHFGVVVATPAELAAIGKAGGTIPRSATRDPWPLITGRATLLDPLTDEDDDMPVFPGAALKHAGTPDAFATLAGARMRARPELDAPIIETWPAGVAIAGSIRVVGDVANGSPDWIGYWAYTGDRWRFGFSHVSTLVDRRDAPDPFGEARTWYRMAPKALR